MAHDCSRCVTVCRFTGRGECIDAGEKDRALAELYIAADALGIEYDSATALDALQSRVIDGPCDGLGTVIGKIPGRGEETGYYVCAGCNACLNTIDQFLDFSED